jgi:hypothetical protein
LGYRRTAKDAKRNEGPLAAEDAERGRERGGDGFDQFGEDRTVTLHCPPTLAVSGAALLSQPFSLRALCAVLCALCG